MKNITEVKWKEKLDKDEFVMWVNFLKKLKNKRELEDKHPDKQYLSSIKPVAGGWVSENVDFDSPEMKKEIEKVKKEIKAVMDGAKIDTSKLHITFR